jgi:hypothetical protein
MPPWLTAQLSLIVAQTRAQYPARSGKDLPFQVRPRPGDSEGQEPEEALSGTGVSMRPGLREQQPRTIQARLFLEKRTYGDGYLLITWEDGNKESWRTIAHDLQGHPERAFDFIYTLATRDGKVAYLALIGGKYEEGENKFTGFEGTLIFPGKAHDLQRWERAYKIDFGYRFPDPPPHQYKVNEAREVFESLQKGVQHVESLQADVVAREARLDALRSRPPRETATEDNRRENRREIGQVEEALAALRKRLTRQREQVEKWFLRYYQLRKEISVDYAAFTRSNPYFWASLERKQKYYDHWKAVEFHHPRIDEWINRFLRSIQNGERLLKARKEAMESVARHNNWDKKPGTGNEPE